VHRDWLGGQMANPYGPEILTTFSERLTYSKAELLPEIGWHEGARLKELKKTGASHYPAVGTLVARNEDKWYAVNGNGTFSFEVPLDKLYYPTTRFLRRDLAVIIDTHGVNMIAEQAIRYNATTVVSDCDHPGKIKAAKYLSEKGVDVICYPDKYVYLAIGHNLNLVGSPPVELGVGKAIIGNRPVVISTNDKILSVNATSEAYSLWYYQTPASYMSTISQILPLNIDYYSLSDFGQMEKATQRAREINANILATRVFNSQDYHAVKRWLDESTTRKAILFHTASYPYGQKILNEYPDRTTFDDPNPT